MNTALDAILEASTSSRTRFVGVLLLATVSHLCVGVAAASNRHSPARPSPRETEIQALPDDPLPPPPPPPPPAPELPEPVKAAAPVLAPNAPPAAAPPPAAAANVLTALDDGPVDLTGGMVVGSAETYAGGAVTASSKLTRAGAATGTKPSDTGTAAPPKAPPQGPDLSRPARLAEGVSWNCPFPPEADEKGIDDAIVGLSVELAATGSVLNVRIEQDPGTGFGRIAAACARSKRFSPAHDRSGNPISGRARVKVRFER